MMHSWESYFGHVPNCLSGYIAGLNSRKGSNFRVMVMGLMNEFVFKTSGDEHFEVHYCLLPRNHGSSVKSFSKDFTLMSFRQELTVTNLRLLGYDVNWVLNGRKIRLNLFK